jgi:hypothetical protein
MGVELFGGGCWKGLCKLRLMRVKGGKRRRKLIELWMDGWMDVHIRDILLRVCHYKLLH